ncbi:toxin-antitoxin system, toxin component [Streptomyces sp. NPDC057877]|uniref:toxin-antitoxin system, toxin component n=1 Tax=Streptomyces sp. NPDC057877 TaxID=3346269 RepID=UPI0036BFA1E2
MSTGPRQMRRFSTRLIRALRLPADDRDVIPAIGQALAQVRGRTVRLQAAAFPPATASGVWIDRTSHDLIVYEKNTDPEHQLVIIGHEAWHMFQGHGRNGSTASRADTGKAAMRAELQAVLSAITAGTAESATGRTDLGLHFAARTDDCRLEEELEAERFGFRFATDVRAVLKARDPVGPRHLAGRIQASMAHRFHQD